jgi:hypothetical protein
MGLVYEDKGELDQALTLFEKASTIYHQWVRPQLSDIHEI